MTNRLYYDNPYLREFRARVEEVCESSDGAWLIRLDQSAFYPTSGGQPYDTGTLGCTNILDVFVDKGGEVWHKTDAPLTEGNEVLGEIDWARRFDHMQQHAGEHILAGAVHRLYQGHTVGLHLGKEASSIDVDFPDGSTRLGDEALKALEDDVNDHIQRDVPISCWFPDAEELKTLPLRKPPTVSEHVRVVQIGDDEFCACGGTHPSSAGQIGLLKIVDARPSKGRLRLTFVCGNRAFQDYRARVQAAEKAALVLSTSWENLPDAVESLLSRVKDAEYHLNKERRERALEGVSKLIENAETVGDMKVVKHVYQNLPMDALREAAAAVTVKHACVALFANETESGVQLLFARSADLTAAMGPLLTASAKKYGGKGGGKPDFAQGACESALAVDEAFSLLSGKP